MTLRCRGDSRHSYAPSAACSRKRHLALLACTATLLPKLLVPIDYMVASDHGRLAIVICSGVAPAAMTMEMRGDMADHGKPMEHGKAEMPCAFSGFAAAV